MKTENNSMPVAGSANHPRIALERLRNWRNHPTLTRAQVSRLCHVSWKRVSQWLRDGRVSSVCQDGEVLISVDSLIAYYRKRVSK